MAQNDFSKEEPHYIVRVYKRELVYNRFVIEKGNKLFDKCHDFDR